MNTPSGYPSNPTRLRTEAFLSDASVRRTSMRRLSVDRAAHALLFQNLPNPRLWG